jgi:hypothetical protein
MDLIQRRNSRIGRAAASIKRYFGRLNGRCETSGTASEVRGSWTIRQSDNRQSRARAAGERNERGRTVVAEKTTAMTVRARRQIMAMEWTSRVIDRTFHPLLDLIRLPKSYRLPSLAPQQRLLTARVLSTCPTSQCATDDSRQPRIPTHTHRKPLLSASFGRCTRYPSCRTTVTAPPTSCYVLPIDPKDGERE